MTEPQRFQTRNVPKSREMAGIPGLARMLLKGYLQRWSNPNTRRFPTLERATDLEGAPMPAVALPVARCVKSRRSWNQTKRTHERL